MLAHSITSSWSFALLLSSIALVSASTPVTQLFVVGCSALVYERIDPIINPGNISGHVHMISGGNAINFTMQDTTPSTSTCTSCNFAQDLSNYWTPNMYYTNRNGTFTAVPIQGAGGMDIYYKQGSTSPTGNSSLTAFPQGFRMVAGNPSLRSCPPGPAGVPLAPISMGCYNGGAENDTIGFPNAACSSGLRMQINFPPCWDGVNLQSADNSHVSYPVGYNVMGRCPASHPVPMINLFYEITYETFRFEFWTPEGLGQPFVLSMGDASGCGLHGDFFSGWQGTALQDAINANVANPDGSSTVGVPGGTFSSNSAACKLTPVLNTTVISPGTLLPGCNPVTGPGPNAARVDNCKRNDNWDFLSASDFSGTQAGSSQKPSTCSSS